MAAQSKSGGRWFATMPSGSRRGHRQRHTVATANLDPTRQSPQDPPGPETRCAATGSRVVATRDLTPGAWLESASFLADVRRLLVAQIVRPGAVPTRSGRSGTTRDGQQRAGGSHARPRSMSAREALPTRISRADGR